MANGRPPTPIEEKRRRGTLRPDRMPAPVGNLAVIPAADPTLLEGMGPVGQAFMLAGASAWLARTDQLGLLRLIEDGWEEYTSLRQRWVASDYSNVAVAKRLGQVEDNLTRWLSLAGLTPTDRSRLGVAAVKAETTLQKLQRQAGHPSTTHQSPPAQAPAVPMPTARLSKPTAASSRIASAGQSAARSASGRGSASLSKRSSRSDPMGATSTAPPSSASRARTEKAPS